MSALWITGYLTTVILGASIAIVAFLRVELWLQTRRIRSRRQHHSVRLGTGTSLESVLALEECADAESSGRKELAKPPSGSVSESTLSPAQAQVKRDVASQTGAALAGGRAAKREGTVSKTGGANGGVQPEATPATSDVRETRAGKTDPAPRTAAVSSRQSGAVPGKPAPSTGTGAKSAESKKNQSAGKERKGAASQANGGKVQRQASPARQTQQAVPGVSLDELYDREVPTVISSELVSEDEGEQELSADDRIEAEVL